MKILETPTLRRLPPRISKVKAVVIHTTGATDLDKILKFYHDEDGFQPHYLIDYTGTIHRFVAEDHVAYHAAHKPEEVALYQQNWGIWSTCYWDNDKPVKTGSFYPGYKAWDRDWHAQGVASPLALVTGNHINDRSIGIELQQPIDKDLTPDIFLDTQYTALAELIADVAGRHNIPIVRQYILGHYDVAPMLRSTRKGGWDPGDNFSWSKLFKQISEIHSCSAV